MNNITIKLQHLKYCQQLQSFGELGSGPPCSCDQLDGKLGGVLNELPNLTILRLDCSLCRVNSHQRHAYLSTLKTRVLQEVQFKCHCSQMKEEMLIKVLSSPSMRSLTTLKWRGGGTIWARRVSMEPFFMNMDILPNLRHLYHSGTDLHHLLLSYRPITRLSGDMAIGIPTYEQLERVSNSLSHLNLHIPRRNFARLFSALARNPSPFRGLQHIGVFYLETQSCFYRCEELLTSLRHLEDLNNLVSVDARSTNSYCFPCGNYHQIFQNGLTELSAMFPKLRQVFLRQWNWLADIWELEETWECQIRGYQLSAFDVIHDSGTPLREVSHN